MLLNCIVQKCTGSYKFSKLQEKVNHFMYIDDKVSAKNKKEREIEIQLIRIYIQDVGMEYCTEKCPMLILKIGK